MGAAFNSLAVKENFADAPTETLRIASPAVGAPAEAVPQYWHRAAGLDDRFIAQAESRQRVKLALEHVVTASAPNGAAVNTAIKIKAFLFISLFIKKLYQKRAGGAKGKINL